MPNRESPSGALTPAEFAAGFRESSRVLWCVAAGVLGDRAQAEDVLQEAAMTALNKLDTFRPGTSFVAWMSQTVRYVALNHRRKRERRRQALQREGRDPLRGHADRIPDAGFDDAVQQALDTLPEAARTCLLLKTVMELEYSEIADVLGIPAGTAMSHVSRARSRMAKLLAAPETEAVVRGAT